MIRRNGVSSMMGLFAGMATSVSTYAQAPETGVLEEVIITAERRAESLNTMAVAGEAFSSAEIERRGIDQIEDLPAQTPGLSIKDSGVNRFVTIRGVGLNATTATITSGVAIHIDGIGLWGAGIALGNPFYDLERIEILRGPQGTFVGQNSTGGAMFIVSRGPKLGENNFFVEQTLGDYKLSDTVAAGNLALSDTVAARLAVKWSKRDSFTTNRGSTDPMFGFNTTDPKVTHESEPGDNEEQAVRLKLMWKPSEDFNVQLLHEKFERKSGYVAAQPLYQWAGSIGNAPANIRQQYAAEIRANTDPYSLAYSTPTSLDIDLDRTSVEFNWQITPGLAFRSQTAVQHFTQSRLIDTDYTIHPIIPVWQAQGGANPATGYMGRPAANGGSPLTETGGWQDTQIGPNRTRTQEFNLLSTTDSPLQWSLGAFYSDQQAFQANFNSILENGNQRQQTQVFDNRNEQSNAAVFGQITWQMTDSLELITGVRYNRDEAENTGSRNWIYRPNPQTAPTGAVLPAQTIPASSAGGSENEATTGKLALNWSLTDDQILYAVVAKGYKAGNFNNQNPLSTSNPPDSFQPETVWSYEAGWKATMFEGRFHSDLTAFQTDYEDYQINFLDGISNQTYVSNLPKARIKGIELQVRAQFGGFGANLSAAKLDSEIVDTGGRDIRDGRRTGVSQNLVGRVLPFAPQTTISAGMEYAFPVGEGTITPRVQYSATDEQWASIFQIPSLVPGSITAANPTGTPDGSLSPDYLPKYDTVDASITWTPNENWMLQVFGTNLTEELYIAGHLDTAVVYGPPRQYGVKFRYSF